MGHTKRQLPALTGMRFFLALWVVIYHQPPPIDQLLFSWPAIAHAVTSVCDTGYAAVGVFFALSGFVLTYNYDLERIRLPSAAVRFGVARFSRIYPAYFIGLIVLVPFSIYRLATGLIDGAGLGSEAFSFVLNLLLLQAWLPTTALTWNYPGWSLSNEAFFYFCFPFIGAWFQRWKKPGALFSAAAMFWMLSLAAPLAAVWLAIPHFGRAPATDVHLTGAGLWANFIRYNPLLRLPDFCMGMVVAQLYRQLPRQHELWNRGAWFYLPAILGCLVIYVDADLIPYPLMHNGLLLPLYSCIIFGFALEGGGLVRLLSTAPMVFLGNVSYSMYILHVPIYSWLGICFTRVLLREANGWLWFICYITAVVAGSSIFYKIIEEPLHSYLRAQLNRRFALHHTETRA